MGHGARGLLGGRRRWNYFPHDHARSRAYRWGEDGLLGICDRECRLCFALALWNGDDPILKERLFGLTGPEGNHGEDVKELYFYLDATPTHSYLQGALQVPAGGVPVRAAASRRTAGAARDEPRVRARRHRRLRRRPLLRRHRRVRQGRARRHPDPHHRRQPRPGRGDAARAADALVPQHLVVGLHGRGLLAQAATRRASGDGAIDRRARDARALSASTSSRADGARPQLLFTENETNAERLFGAPNAAPYVKDAFHDYVVDGERDAVNPRRRRHEGGGALPCSTFRPGGEVRAAAAARGRARARRRDAVRRDFDAIFASAQRARPTRSTTARSRRRCTPSERNVARQAYAGLLWSQAVLSLRRRATGSTAIPASRRRRREPQARPQPRLAAPLRPRRASRCPTTGSIPGSRRGISRSTCVPLARIDPEFAKEQLLLLLREWYMHPNGQLPAYEFAFGDVNPPVHAWAVLARLQDDRRRAAQRDRAVPRARRSRSCCSTSPGG